MVKAIGLTALPNGTGKAPIQNLGWGNPMGGLFASSRDLAQTVILSPIIYYCLSSICYSISQIALMFRTNQTADNGQQILDGATITGICLVWQLLL